MIALGSVQARQYTAFAAFRAAAGGCEHVF